YKNDLPERAVAITFDDGLADFYTRAFPLIKEFDFPVSLYLTTFYSEFQRPVFDLMVAYLVWKGRNQTLNLKAVTRQDLTLSLHHEDNQDRTRVAILEFAAHEKLSSAEKDALLVSLARELHVDYDALLAQRIMHNV